MVSIEMRNTKYIPILVILRKVKMYSCVLYCLIIRAAYGTTQNFYVREMSRIWI